MLSSRKKDLDSSDILNKLAFKNTIQCIPKNIQVNENATQQKTRLLEFNFNF